MGICGNKSSSKNSSVQPTPRDEKLQILKVSPEVFVQIQEGSISDFYRIGDIIGEGGFGCVRLVTHKQTQNKRAMKEIKKDSLFKEDEETLFAEMDILKQIDHPNIVKVFELYQDQSQYYLITEYCEGGELFEKLDGEQFFTEKKAAEYMKQLFSAVAYCHERQIVHRDLKLENLLLDSRNDNANLKVIDFGTSRKINGNQKLTKKLGTPYYIAPEVMSSNYDQKCDVWSCGIILYTLLCGYPPFIGEDEEIFAQIKIGKYQYDPEDWQQISKEARQLIDRLLTYDPKQRPSIMEVQNDPWLTTRAPNIPFSHQHLKKLQNFYKPSQKWKSAIQMFIVTQLQTNKEKSELLEQFKALDKDQNGTLSRNEIIEDKAYTKLHGDKEKAIKICDELFQACDQNQSGQIDFSEFLMAAANQENIMSKQKLEKAFKLFDRDGNGYITKNELQTIFSGLPLDQQQWKEIFEHDVNHDGQLSLEEFIKLMQSNELSTHF